MKPQNMKVGPRTLLTADGQPVLVGLVMREATSAPSRLKAALVVPIRNDDGIDGIVPLPFATATKSNGKTNGWTPEFRLEMN